MNKIEVFYPNESPTMPNYYTIGIHHELFKLKATVGSYNLIMARLCGISYANFLRMCRDSFDAKIVGRGTYYPVAYFNSPIACRAVCDLLNSYATLVLWNDEHPDFEEHKAILKNLVIKNENNTSLA